MRANYCIFSEEWRRGGSGRRWAGCLHLSLSTTISIGSTFAGRDLTSVYGFLIFLREIDFFCIFRFDEKSFARSEKWKIDVSLIKLNIMKCLTSMSYHCVYLVISLNMKAISIKGMHLNHVLTSVTALDKKILKIWLYLSLFTYHCVYLKVLYDWQAFLMWYYRWPNHSFLRIRSNSLEVCYFF